MNFRAIVVLPLLALATRASAQEFRSSTGLRGGLAPAREGIAGFTIGIDQSLMLGSRVALRADARFTQLPFHGDHSPSDPSASLTPSVVSTQDVRTGGPAPTRLVSVTAGLMVFHKANRRGLFAIVMAGPQQFRGYHGREGRQFVTHTGLGIAVPFRSTIATFEVALFREMDASRHPHFTVPITIGFRLP